MSAPRNSAEMRAKAQDAGWQYGIDRPACVYCGAWIGHKGKTTQGRIKLTIDHFIPRSAGGPNNEANRVPACHACNAAKSSMDPVDFIRQLGDRARLTVEHVERARSRILVTATPAPERHPATTAEGVGRVVTGEASS